MTAKVTSTLTFFDFPKPFSGEEPMPLATGDSWERKEMESFRKSQCPTDNGEIHDLHSERKGSKSK